MKPQLKNVPISIINSGEDNFKPDNAKVSRIAELIKRHGLIEPLVVTLTNEGYQLMMGKHRLLAAKIAGLKEVPVMIIDDSSYGRLSGQPVIDSYVTGKLQLLNIRPKKHVQQATIIDLAVRHLKKACQAFSNRFNYIAGEGR